MPTVRVEEVSKRYGTVSAVDDVSLAIDDGRLLTLLGPSGCGKTTTLRMIAGLEENDRGRILIGDRVVSDPARGVFVPPERRQIGMVFQSYAIWPHMSVFANVAYPLEVRRRPRAEIRRRVLEILRLVELDDFADRQATMLSGGQQQRVAIARALVFEPEVLLMDEPLSNLDAKLREQTRGEIHRLQRRLAITTIYVTHDQEEAMVLSDLIAVMHDGHVLQMAPPEETYNHPASRTVATFFGTPNLLAGKAREVRGNGVTALARVEGDGWDGWVAAPPGVRPGDAGTVLLRPEALQIADGPLAGDLAWRGRLRESIFRGSRRVVTVEAGRHLFTVDAPSDQPFRKDEHVWLRANPARAWVLRE